MLQRIYMGLGIVMVASPLVAVVADRAASQGILARSAALEHARMPVRLVQTAPLDRRVDEPRLELGFDAA